MGQVRILLLPWSNEDRLIHHGWQGGSMALPCDCICRGFQKRIYGDRLRLLLRLVVMIMIAMLKGGFL